MRRRRWMRDRVVRPWALALLGLALAGCAHPVEETGMASAGDAVETAASQEPSPDGVRAPPLVQPLPDTEPFPLSAEPALRALAGRIEGLTSPGLVLTDGMGRVVRPVAGSAHFAFYGGQPYVKSDDTVQLMVARQPSGQSCSVTAEDGEGQLHSPLVVRCEPTSTEPPSMRDCFRVFTQGATFTLGRKTGDQWEPYAEVTMDPVGYQRLHHRTLLNQGRVMFESITLLEDDPPRAMVELMVSGGEAPDERVRTVGKWGGMPLDLAVGEARGYTVIVQRHAGGKGDTGKTESMKKVVSLVGMGPLETQAGRFPLVCHLVERVTTGGRERVWASWYAPGYGPIRLEATGGGASGAVEETLEVLEVRRRPR